MLTSRIIIGFMLSLFLLSNVSARFYFQGNTILDDLRLCNASSCEILADGNLTSIDNPISAYEVRGDRYNVNIWDFVHANQALIISGFVILGVVAMAFMMLRRRR